MAKKFGKRLDKIEKRLDDLEKVPSVASIEQRVEDKLKNVLPQVGQYLEQQIGGRQFTAHVKRAMNEVFNTSSRSDAQLAKEVAQQVCEVELRSVRKDIAELEDAIKEVRASAQKAVQGTEFTEHLAHETERWNEVNRALGQIEGMLHGVRDRMSGRGGSQR